MLFSEVHPLNYTILFNTKGDLFSILFGVSLDIQTLSPKVSLVIIRKEKRWQTIQQKLKHPDLFSIFIFNFSPILLSKKWKLLWFLEKSLPTWIQMSEQYALNYAHLSTRNVVLYWQQSAKSFRRNYMTSSVNSRAKNLYFQRSCLRV